MYHLRSLELWGNQLEECLPFHLNRREPPYISPREWATCEAGSYAFNIRDDASQGASVGRVYIPGRLADTVSYVIASGNEDGVFAIDSSSGRISVASELDASAVDAYSLTVAASDGIGDPVRVEIRVNPAPSPPTCASGIAVPNPEENPGLVNDCRILLEVKELLAGRTWLNWSAEAPLEQWEAVELGGTPRRVLALEIRGPHGGGRIPPELGGLTALRRLVISDNRSWGPHPKRTRPIERVARTRSVVQPAVGGDSAGTGAAHQPRKARPVGESAGRASPGGTRTTGRSARVATRAELLPGAVPTGRSGSSSAAGRHVAGLADV